MNALAEAPVEGLSMGTQLQGEQRRIAQLKEDFLSACSTAFDQFMFPDGELFAGTFTEIETFAEKNSRFLGALLCEKRLAADPLSSGDRHFQCPRCRKKMRIQSPAQHRTLPTVMGDVQMDRPYCVCDACGFCCAPLDYVLGIPAKGPSVGRRELICNAATKDRSFEKAVRTMADHSKITVSDEAIRNLAESEGRKMVKARAQRVQLCFEKQGQLPEAPAGPVPFLVVTCDGGMVQTRDKKERWKSDKVGCVYDAQPAPDVQAPAADKYRGAAALTKTYVATMDSWELFGPMLFAEACARGYINAVEKLFISDGALAIIDLRSLHFSDAHAIIDWYHASEHLHHCAKAAFGGGTAENKEWVKDIEPSLWEGKLPKVIAAIRRQSQRVGPPPPKALDTDPRVILHRNVGYFTRNQNEMDYPTYRARGWPIGSGVAEGSVRQFALRVKGSEQYWNLWGAEEMLALCAAFFSEDGRWHNYWALRSAPPDDAFVLRNAFILADPPRPRFAASTRVGR